MDCPTPAQMGQLTPKAKTAHLGPSHDTDNSWMVGKPYFGITSRLLVIHPKPRFDCNNPLYKRSKVQCGGNSCLPSPLPLHFYSKWCNLL